MTTHLSSDDAARWVAGVLDDDRALELEAHARGCPPCEALLAAEARADERLTLLVRQVPAPGVRTGRRLPPAVLALLPFALAASLILFFSQVPAPGSGGGSPDAGFEGVAVGAAQYERGALIPPEALTADEPFPL